MQCFGGGRENVLKLTVVMVIRVTFKWYVNGVVWFVNYVSIKLLKATCGISWQLEKNKQDREIETGLQSLGSALCAPLSLCVSLSPELKHLGNGSSLPVLEGDSLRLACDTDSNPPATLSWSQGSRTLSPSHPSSPGVLYLPRVESGHEGELTCRAQHPRGSLWISVHLSVQSELRWGGKKTPRGEDTRVQGGDRHH